MDRLKKGFRSKKSQVADYIKIHTKGTSSNTTPQPQSLALSNASDLGSPTPTPISRSNQSTAETMSIASANITPATHPMTTAPISSLHNTNPKIPLAPTLLLNSESHKRPVAWVGLHNLSGVLENTSGVFRPLKSAVKGITECIEMYERESDNREEYATLKADLEARFQDLAGYFHNPIPSAMTGSIVNLANGIIQEISTIQRKQGGSTIGRYAQAQKDADDILGYYRRINTLVERLAQNANINIWRIVDEQAAEHRLEKLSHSAAAWYSSAESMNRRNRCTPQTRIRVLADINNWVYEGIEKVYWLNGMAGTGKTTIACSLSDELYKDSKLAASFFCSRQIPSCRDVNFILPTISYQLARFSRPFRYALSGILEQHPDVHTRQLSEQFEGLIANPPRLVGNAIPEGLVIVIDGLDECSNHDGVEAILEILISNSSRLPIKYFVSSRPEPKIASQMHAEENETAPFQLRLHELERSIVRHDIEIYLKAELQSMHLLPSDLQQLTDRCDVLFIYAATAARYIKSGGRARSLSRTKEVLGAPAFLVNDKRKTIDSLYTTILAGVFDSTDLNDEDGEEIRTVLHSVICAQEPLTPRMIASLLKMRSEELALEALGPLSSVLSISERDDTVNTLHASFPDYLFDESRSGSFHCRSQEHSARLTRACFDLIKVPNPPFNICELESSFVFDKDVPNLEECVRTNISAELFYACRHWSSHLRIANKTEALLHELQEFLSVRLLFWMEVMNLKQCIHLGAYALSKVKLWTQGPQSIQELLIDASRFTTAFSLSPMSRSTPHIYVSGLLLWPRHLPVAQYYSQRISGSIKATGAAMGQRDRVPLAIWDYAECVSSTAYSPDGAYIVGGFENGIIKIWEAYGGQEVGKPLEGHTRRVNSVSYSPDGGQIVSCSDDYTIRVWDTKTGQTIGSPLEGYVGFQYATYSPDGAHIVSGFDDGTVRIWDAKTGLTVGDPLEGHSSLVSSVSYSPDGTRIVSSSWDDSIRIWDAKTGQSIGEPLKGHTNMVTSVSYSPDGTRIVSGSWDNTIRLWEAHSGLSIGKPFEGHTDCVNSVSYSPDGAHIVSGSQDNTIRIWDADTGWVVGSPLEGHTFWVTSVSYSPDGTRLVSCSDDRTIRIWDAPISQGVDTLLEGHTQGVSSISWSPDSAHIASGSYDNTIRIWDSKTGQAVSEPLRDQARYFDSVSYSPNGAHIISGSSDKCIRIWDAVTGRMIGNPLKGHSDYAMPVSCSPDGENIVCGYDNGNIQIWDARVGQTVGEPLKGHSDLVTSVSYLPDGARIVSGSRDRSIRIWDAKTGQSIGNPLEGHTNYVNSVSCSPNGIHIASGSDDNTIRIWNGQSGQSVGKPFQGHTGGVSSVSYSPDGAYIVSGSHDMTIRIWDAQTGQTIVGPLEGHTDSVTSVSYSSDGTRIASGSHDETIRIWSSQNGQILGADGAQSSSHEDCGIGASSGLWSVNADGWIMSSSREPLVWVPSDLRGVLLRPQNTTVISRKGWLRLDFTDARIGRTWWGCYQPRDVSVNVSV